MSRKILITGGSGLVGRNLIEILSRDQNNNLDVLYRHNRKPNLIANNVKAYYADIHSFTSEVIYDIVVHCAAKKDLLWCENNIAECMQVNVGGTLHLLETLQYKGFVFLSSDMAGDIFPDGSYTTIYGLSKHIAENIITSYTNVISVKSGVIYEEPVEWIDQLVGTGEELQLYRDRFREYVSVDDYVVELIKIIDEVDTDFWGMDRVIHGSYCSQVEWAIKYLCRRGLIDKAKIKLISRIRTEHGMIGSASVRP